MRTRLPSAPLRSLSLILLGALAMAGCGTASFEGDPLCGNGVLEVGEACDDGNTASGDGCSSSCIPDQSTSCGNSVIDSGESCDDGNTASGDGCDSNCALEDECGNGVEDADEQCDDGNNTDGDGCDVACQLEEGCGDDVRKGSEECDDGNTDDGDGCSATCLLEAGVCGDGIFNSGEQCDDGNKTAGDGCDGECRLEGAVCGNGVVDPGEECDNGNLVNFDGCSNSCQIERCGDSVVQPGETCDDGNTVSSDGCSALCVAEGNITCGNGVLELGEECDDGNTTNGDGCASDCSDENTGICTEQFTLTCGATDTWNTTFFGSTNELETYSCVPGFVEDGSEYTYRYVAQSSGLVRLALSGMTSDLDVFVIADDGDCSQDSCLHYGNTTTEFNAVAGTTYYIVVDGYHGAQGPYSISMSCGSCGDGNLDAGEGCDDGNALDDDGCSASCQSEGGVCLPDLDIDCGTTDVWSTLNLGSTDVIDSYTCAPFDESGREYSYRFAPLVDTTMSITLTPQAGVDLDLFLLADDGNSLCQGGDCALYADNTVQATFPGGGEYYIVVDGYNGAEGSYSIDFACDDASQSCLDGQGNNGDSCADVYQGSDIWRCTTSPALGGATVSQVCRYSASGPKWITFHTNPTECCACAGDFDVGCCAANSGSSGCP